MAFVGGETQLLALMEDREAAEAILEHKAMLGTDRHHVYLLQEYIAKSDIVVSTETIFELLEQVLKDPTKAKLVKDYVAKLVP